jgi:tetratricopeptide (TPR) repeat protein
LTETERAENLLRQRNFSLAIEELNRALRVHPGDPRINFLLAKAYLRSGEAEDSGSYFSLAERALRKAIESDNFNQDYHDRLIEITAKRGALDELSIEYNTRKKDNPEFYEKLLGKISAISLLSIPEPGKKQPKPKGAAFIRYAVMPLVASGALIAWLHPKYHAARIPFLVIMAGYFALRISLRPRSRA